MKKVLLPLGIIVLSILVAVVMATMRSKPPKKPHVTQATLVETIKVTPRDLQFSIASQGVVTPRTQSSLVAEVSGSIVYVSPHFVAGGYFNRGDTLLRINPADYKIAVDEAQARLAGDEARLAEERARARQAQREWKLTGRPLVEAPALALRLPQTRQIEASIRASKANLANAQLRLQRTNVVAPYAGLVRKKKADIGQYVTVGSSLADYFAVDYAEVRLPLTEHEVAFVRLPNPGSPTPLKDRPKVTLSTEVGGQTYRWHGFITRAEGVIDDRSRVYYVVAQINDPYGLKPGSKNPPLRIGSYVSAQIEGRKAKQLLRIPRDAMRGLKRVLVMDQHHTLRVRTLTVVRSDHNWVYARSGLAATDRIITTALDTPVEGMTLRDQNSAASGTARDKMLATKPKPTTATRSTDTNTSVGITPPDASKKVEPKHAAAAGQMDQ